MGCPHYANPTHADLVEPDAVRGTTVEVDAELGPRGDIVERLDPRHLLGQLLERLGQAVLEGIAFNLSLVLQALEDFTGKAKRIQATGGFARSGLWRQMMADVFDREVTVPERYESSCLGAAVLGLYALKKITSLNIVSEMIGETYRHQPIAANVETYKKILPIYTRVLQNLQGEYESIARLQAELTQR